ncbi:MAG: zinc-ribbon domain-containing protein, partial [Acutalibacteraceae bacterium]
MDKIICSECGTENESEYTYCKNCGAPLVKPANRDETEFIGSEAQNPPQGYAEPQGNSYSSADYTPPTYTEQSFGGQQYSPYGAYNAYAIDGVPADDVAFFIGKKSTEIMPKFIKMEITRSKTSWCWPAAILGFFFGPLGAAIWFFYRKMYKIALILLAAGAVITFSTAALTYNTDSTVIDSVIGSLADGNLNSFMDALENIDGNQTALDLIASGIEDLASLATCIL